MLSQLIFVSFVSFVGKFRVALYPRQHAPSAFGARGFEFTMAVFITGFPGFIAGRLVARLAADEPEFILLVQPAFRARAEADVARLAAELGRPAGAFRLVTGDITAPHLGLSAADAADAQTRTTLLFHLAAIYDLAVPREPAWRVNVEGTQNVNAFARTLPHLQCYHYISTCYVAGLREGLIMENELRHEAGWRNFYEETKYLAEVEVDNLKGEIPLTIHRPAVVCGDSVTGETAKYDGVYYLIRYLQKWPRLLSGLNIGNDTVRINLVPVDFVVEALVALARDPHAIGQTLQLADPAPLTTRELFDIIASTLAGHGSFATLPMSLTQKMLHLPFTPRLTGLPHSGVPYFFLSQTYDTRQATNLLTPHGVACPRFADYINNLIAFVKKHPTLG